MELEDLWNDTRRNAYVAKVAAKRDAKRDAKLEEKPDTKKLYLDPENWTRIKGVAIVHRETNSIVGNFSEYRHNSLPDVRKLVREEAPISVSATEYVEGSWWLGEGRRPEPKQAWHEQRPLIVHLYLEELKVHAPACEIVAHLSYGAIARVELALDTQLAQSEGAEQLVFLPAGTNISEVMGLDMKMIIRKELGI